MEWNVRDYKNMELKAKKDGGGDGDERGKDVSGFRLRTCMEANNSRHGRYRSVQLASTTAWIGK